MDVQQINSLFKLDKIVSNPGTENERGSGFGLLISKEFIEKNNGSLHFRSMINEGSLFMIRFPVQIHDHK